MKTISDLRALSEEQVNNPKPRLLDTVWIMIREDGWYPIQPSSKCKPEDHAELNPDIIRIEDADGIVLWRKQ